jgi:hypothetical protein
MNQTRGGHEEGGALSPRDITMDLEHADQHPHGSLYVHAHVHLTFETKLVTNINFFFIQNNCLLVYASPHMLMKKMNKKNRKVKFKRTHVLPVLLEQGNQDADTNLAAMLDMPLPHNRLPTATSMPRTL